MSLILLSGKQKAVKLLQYNTLEHENTEHNCTSGQWKGIERNQSLFYALKIKFVVTQDSPYDPEFVAKINKSRKQAAEGKTVKIDLDDIWK